MKNKILVILSIALFINYCAKAQQVYSYEQQKKYHKNRRFKLAKQIFLLKDTSIITTNAVYINKMFPVAKWQSDTTYFYFRFFNDGTMFISYPYKSNPSAIELNDLSYGEYMRYIIEDGGRIKMEVVGDYNKLRFIYGRIYGSQIITFVTLNDWKKDRQQPSGIYQRQFTKFYNWPK